MVEQTIHLDQTIRDIHHSRTDMRTIVTRLSRQAALSTLKLNLLVPLDG